MSKNVLNINEAVALTSAVKDEFTGVFIADCCNSKITKGNSFYSIPVGGESDEVAYECCTKCLKTRAYYEKHKYDDFDAETYLSAVAT